MKILYVTRGTGVDYMNDLLFHGLHALFGTDVVDSNRLWHLYPEYVPYRKLRRLYGRGFSIAKSIPKDEVDRTDIVNKIKANFYDYIIYGQINRCTHYLKEAIEHYPLSRIIMIDGEDAYFNAGNLFPDDFIYFKRELIISRRNTFPISFAFMEDRIVKNTSSIKKNQKFGTVIPGDTSTYKFKIEKSYYKDYQKSYFGITHKKAGWDCMRHYEIIANYCLPYFTDLDKCPKTVMTNYPKQLGLEANKLAESKFLDIDSYYNVLNETFDYFKTHMTTRHLAEYVLNTVRKLQ